jgi:ribosomal protein L40E
MRAKIIQYNGTTGEGIALAEGSQYDFTIRHWRSDTAPATGQTIEITLDNGQVAAIFLVGKDVLLKEMASQVGSNISQGIANGQMPSMGAIGFDSTDIVKRVGKPALIAYAVFVIALLFMQVAKISVFGQAVGFTMWGAFSHMGGSGFLKFLFVVALIAPVVPIFLRQPFAWFALGTPLLFYVVTGLSVMSDLSAAQDQLGMLGKEFGKQMAKAASDAVSIGIGAYLGSVAALVMAAFGYLNFRRDASGAQGIAVAFKGSQSTADPVMTQRSVTEPTQEVQTAKVTSMDDHRVCLKCGGKSASDAKFCGHCGHPF